MKLGSIMDQETLKHFESKSTEELKELVEKQNTQIYQEEVFEFIRNILDKRNNEAARYMPGHVEGIKNEEAKENPELPPPPIPINEPLNTKEIDTIIPKSKIRTNKAGFWIRLLAFIIDYLFTFSIFSLIWIGFQLKAPEDAKFYYIGTNFIIMGSSMLTFLAWFYYATFESKRSQATPGKIITGLKVTTINYTPISFGLATIRYFSKCFSFLILGIGFLMVAFDKNKQALHDKIALTYVIKNPDKNNRFRMSYIIALAVLILSLITSIIITTTSNIPKNSLDYSQPKHQALGTESSPKTKQLSSYKQYVNNQYGFKISYPADWNIKEGTVENTRFKASKNIDSDKFAVVSVNTQLLNKDDLKIEDMDLDYMVNNIRNTFGTEYATVLHKSRGNVSGKSSVIFLLEVNLPGIDPFVQYSICSINGRYLYGANITCDISYYNNNLEQISYIANSFSFTR